MNFIDIVHASSEAVESAPDGLLASFGIEPKLFLFQLGNFIIVALVLWFLILKPLSKKLSERQRLIDESLDNAKKVEENLAKSRADYQLQLRLARAEAEKILERAAGEAAGLGEEMKAKAKKEIEDLVSQAKQNIKAERQEMMAGLKKETADLVALALEKILNEKMTGERDKKFVREILEKLK